MRRFIPFAIPSGSSPAVQTQTKSATITTNGESVTVQPDSGFLLSSATVTADIPAQSKTATITANGGSATVHPDSGFLLSSATVTARIPTEEKPLSVTENGNYTITPTAGKLMTKATVSVNIPTGGELAEGQVAVHDIPGGKILSAQTVLSATTADNAVTATITLPGSLFGELPDYIILVSDIHSKVSAAQSFEYGANVGSEYTVYGGLYRNGSSNAWAVLSSSSAKPHASVDGTTLTITAGSSTTYKWAAGTVTFYAIYTSDDAT